MQPTIEQIRFMRGEAPAATFEVWWPLLQAGFIVPNDNPPPLFRCTPAGDSLARAEWMFLEQDDN